MSGTLVWENGLFYMIQVCWLIAVIIQSKPVCTVRNLAKGEMPIFLFGKASPHSAKSRLQVTMVDRFNTVGQQQNTDSYPAVINVFPGRYHRS